MSKTICLVCINEVGQGKRDIIGVVKKGYYETQQDGLQALWMVLFQRRNGQVKR